MLIVAIIAVICSTAPSGAYVGLMYSRKYEGSEYMPWLCTFLFPLAAAIALMLTMQELAKTQMEKEHE